MRRLMSLLSVSLVACASALVSGCASSSGASAPAPIPRTITGAAGTLTIANAATADVSHFTYSPDAVFRILPSVYDSLAIPVASLDPAKRQIGNPGFKVRARLGKVILSKYLDCGSSQIGPNADSYDVVLTVNSSVVAEGAAGAALSTIVEAQAKPATYNQGYSSCSSKGGIELRIAELAKARLAK